MGDTLGKTFVLALWTGLLLSRAAAQGTCTAPCPSMAVCRKAYGTPVCVCPTGQHLVNNKCTPASLPHSDWLDWINNARAAVGSPALRWDDTLADQAWSHAQLLGNSSGCPLRHIVPTGEGQVLQGGPGRYDPSLGIPGAVLAWLGEGAKYTYSVMDGKAGGCRGGDWRKCGHYTQLIWSTTTRIGCGVAKCLHGASTAKIWACNLKPAGNILGRYPYKMHPCFNVHCPGESRCDGSSGAPVCECPEGYILINGTCQEDPCSGYNGCTGDMICRGSSGAAVCSCPSGTVPVAAGSTQCLHPQCLGVECPGTSSCDATKGEPFCACPPGQVLQDSTCTKAPSGPLILTSVALYNNTSSSPRVLRFARLGQCVRLPLAFRLASYSILWAAPSSLSRALPRGAAPLSCSRVLFWNHASCVGQALGWRQEQGDIQKPASGLFKAAAAVKCV